MFFDDDGPHRPARGPAAPAGNPHRAQREGLPMFAQRGALLAALDRSQVVVVEGETGSGKSTQVPQYVLEAAAEARTPCSIICTQPRRISALGLADRVAAERGEAVGGPVGQHAGMGRMAAPPLVLPWHVAGHPTR